MRSVDTFTREVLCLDWFRLSEKMKVRSHRGTVGVLFELRGMTPNVREVIDQERTE